MLESFIHMAMLRGKYLKSLRLFLASRKKIKNAKKHFYFGNTNCSNLKTVNEVAVFILDDIKGKNIIKF
jgi:hypothetical protein